MPYAICCLLIVTIASSGCDQTKDENSISGAAAIATTDQIKLILGRWQTVETDSEYSTVWEFTEDGKVKSGPDVLLTGTFSFPKNDVLEIAWDDIDAGKVSFNVTITENEFERSVISIDLGDGAILAEGPSTIMKRADQ